MRKYEVGLILETSYKVLTNLLRTLFPQIRLRCTSRAIILPQFLIKGDNNVGRYKRAKENRKLKKIVLLEMIQAFGDIFQKSVPQHLLPF